MTTVVLMIVVAVVLIAFALGLRAGAWWEFERDRSNLIEMHAHFAAARTQLWVAVDKHDAGEAITPKDLFIAMAAMDGKEGNAYEAAWKGRR